MRERVLEILTKARSLISSRTHWCKHVLYDDKGATCAKGALETAGDGKFEADESLQAAMTALRAAAADMRSRTMRDADPHDNITDDIEWVNDVLGHEPTLECFDMAIKKVEAT